MLNRRLHVIYFVQNIILSLHKYSYFVCVACRLRPLLRRVKQTLCCLCVVALDSALAKILNSFAIRP